MLRFLEKPHDDARLRYKTFIEVCYYGYYGYWFIEAKQYMSQK